MSARELGWPTLAALLLALAVAILAVTSSDPAFAFYKFWWLPAFGIAFTILACWRSRRPWLLLLLLAFLVPLLPLAGLLAACAMGDCI